MAQSSGMKTINKNQDNESFELLQYALSNVHS